MSKIIDKRLKSLEQGGMQAKRMEYLSELRLDVGPAQALDELLSMPEDETEFYLKTISNETLDALQTALDEYLQTHGDANERQASA